MDEAFSQHPDLSRRILTSNMYVSYLSARVSCKKLAV